MLTKSLRSRLVLGVVGISAAIAGGVWWLSQDKQATLGDAVAGETFAAVDCQARFFENSPAIALMFTSPLDTRQSFKDVLTVIDLGEEKSKSGQRNSGDEGAKKNKRESNPPSENKVIDPPKDAKSITTSWVVSDNPRVAYLPHIQPNHRYRITLAAALKSSSKDALGKNLSCEVTAEAMPPAFFFASKGTMLPAKQNGGLPVVTINVSEVDVQFLRVEPSQLPRFMDRIVGHRAKKAEVATENEDGEDGGYYDYNRPRGPQGALQGYELDQLRSLSKSVYLGRFVTDQRENRRNVTHLPVEDIKELQEPGIYIAVMSQPGRFRYEFQTTYFYVSDIGIHARRYADAIEVYATSLMTGKALSGTEFQLLDDNGKSLGKVDSDGDGRARFVVKSTQARVIMAKRGREFSLLSLVEPALDLSEFDTGGHLARPIKIFAYAGRDLYRPGEAFDASILVRDLDGKPVAPTPLTATFKRADGKVVKTLLLKPNDATPGFLTTKWQLPQDAQTGTWILELRADPAAKQPDNIMKLQVEEFLPERMKLDLTSETPFLKPGDNFTVDVKGDYLYGAPAAGNRVMATLMTERNRIPFAKDWPSFEFGDFDDDKLKKREEVSADKLGDDGTTTLSADMMKDAPSSPLSMRMMVSLLESGGRPVVRTIERTLWPAERMIGVRPVWSGKFVREGTPAEFEVIRVNREGKFEPMPGNAKATMRVYREDRDYYWAFDDDRGWHSGFHEGNELIDSLQIDLSKRAKVSFPTKWGRYRIEIADAQTGMTLRYRFYAGWGAEEAEQLGSRPDRVQLKLDKSGYQPGDTAKLTITPPHDGEALVLVEGGEALYQKRVSVSAKGTTVNVPVAKDWNRHDLYISVVAFRPGNRAEKVTPARAMGLTYLPIDRENRKIAVKLTAPSKIEPESKLTVKVKADGLQNEKALVTISAVDIGILNITRFTSPDAFDFFMGKQRYQPDVLDLYGKFIETMEGTKGRLKFGGDASMRDQKKSPQKVKLVDLYSGPIQLNAQGEADVSLNIPDFNGTLRLMAVVAAPTRFGKAEAEVVSAASIVAELATPRFISPGDRAAVALDVTNMTNETQTFAVRVKAEAPIRINGGTESITLKPQQKRTLRMNAEALDGFGQGVVTVEVKGNSKSQPKVKRESLLVISPLLPQERVRRFQRIGAGESVKLDAAMFDGYHAGSALMSVTMSATPPINVNELVKGLLQYPYGCLEQTTSRAFPQVLLDDKLAQSFGLKPLAQAERERGINEAIGRISGMQRASGAFALWGDGADEPWLTAYVVDFLKTARTAGYAVPDAMQKRAEDWMLKQLQQAGTSFPAIPKPKASDAAKLDDAITRDAAWWADMRNRDVAREGHRRFGALAYMGFVLAREERAPLSSLRTLYDDYRDRALSPLPLVHLGLALKRMGDNKRAEQAFEQAMRTSYGMSSYDWEWLGDYGSKLRDTALAYALLEANQIKVKRQDNLVAELIDMMPRKQWLSTQEQMALLLAAKSFAGGTSPEWQASVEAPDAKAESVAGKQTEMREWNSAQAKRGVTITNTGKESMFVSMEASGYAISPAKARDSKDAAMQLRRTLYTADGTLVGDRQLQVGEQLLVHLEVVSQRKIEDGLIVDRVPAGLEIENLNLSQGNKLTDFKPPTTGSENRPVAWWGGKRTPKTISESLADSRIKHREFRDDRYVAAARIEGVVDLYYIVRVVTPGTFVIPPSFAEDMYRPELRAVAGGGGSLTIVDRN
jgi:alpha-2-macroglobulin